MQLSYTPLFSDPTLKAYYKFENGALTTDSSSNGNTLTNHGTVTDTAAKYGNGASITSSSQWFDRTTNLGITGGPISIVGWIKINTEPTAQQYNLGFQSDLTNQVGYWIDYEYNGGTRRLNFARYKVGTAVQNSYYTVTLGTSVFHHLALTYDGADMVGYLDGVEVVRTAYSGNGTGSSLADLITVAQDSVNGDQNANHGLYDDVAFFSKALSVTEIGWLVEAGSPSPSASNSPSPSRSPSLSPSVSPSLSPSITPSASPSISASSSVSPSSSISLSPSLTPSPSPSLSPSSSISASLSPSASPSPSPVENTLSVDLVCVSFITVYADTYTAQGTSYEDIYTLQSTPYTDVYDQQNTEYEDIYTSKNSCDC
jgi:hypothetical protein